MSNRTFPKPPQTEDVVVSEKAVLHDEDLSFILDTCLKESHRRDPNIIKFITSYIQCRDPKQAAHEAGLPMSAGYSLRNRKDINEAITKITDTAVMKYGLDPAEIVEKVKSVAFVDPADLVDEDGVIYENLRDIPPEARRAIKKFKVKNLYSSDPNGMKVVIGKLVEVEMWDKLKANEFLGREKNLFKETKKIEHDVTTNMKDLLLESADRAEARRLAMREQDVVEMRDVGRSDDGDGTAE